MATAAASPTPAAAPTKAHNHPPYKEMIAAALESLKDRKGSSKTAIAKYIGSNYRDLPPTHSSLLSHHLHRLKNEGFLQMVVKSYKLAHPGGNQTAAAKRLGRPPKRLIAEGSADAKETGNKKRGRPKKNSAPGVDPSTGLEKRKPGRPRKTPGLVQTGTASGKQRAGRRRKSLSVSELSLSSNVALTASGEKRKRGRPKKGSAPIKAKPAAARAVREKKRPGRPRKNPLGTQQGLSVGSMSHQKRRPGRPRKGGPSPIKLEVSTVQSSSGKRGRGRPKKTSSVPKPASHSALGEKKKRGRPKKSTSPFQSESSGRKKVGRPRKGSAALSSAMTLSSGQKKKRGRPKKSASPLQSESSGRKVGRPRKGTTALSSAATLSSGEKRKRGRPKKVSMAVGNGLPMSQNISRDVTAPTGNGGLNALLYVAQNTVVDAPAAVTSDNENALPLVQNTVGEVSGATGNGADPPTVLAASNTGGEVSAEVEVGGSSLNRVVEEAAEGVGVAATTLLVDMPGEKKKRGRPKKGLTSFPDVSNDGGGLPEPVASPKKRGRPPKNGNPATPVE